MAEQIILNTDLYDNLLTERKGDYTFPIILIVGEGGGGDSESPDEI